MYTWLANSSVTWALLCKESETVGIDNLSDA